MLTSVAARPRVLLTLAWQEKLPFQLPLLYRGWYNCPQGKTWLQVHVSQWPRAVIDFTPDAQQHRRCASKFAAIGTYNPTAKELHFAPGQWLSANPCNYETIPFTGIVSPDGRTYTGKVAAQSCGQFTLIQACGSVRFRAALSQIHAQ